MNMRKILLVSDVQLFLEQEKTFSDAGDYTLLRAGSGTEALEIVSNERPDLVFMEISLPDISGDKCCYTMKADEGLGEIPVIMITDGVDAEDFERCLQAGCDDIIIKPINRHYLLAIAHKFLNIRHRKTPRFVAQLRVHYGVDQESLRTGYSVNLSTGGIFIETEDFLAVDTPLILEFILPKKDNAIRTQGRIAWINHPELKIKPNLPIGIGVQFLGTSLDDTEDISQYIKNEALMPFW
ncbi:MAG: response regulator [Deltaproteobacteria bacterium]|nr:MAG: response regulator [Deltaproteobacteria bacterium]